MIGRHFISFVVLALFVVGCTQPQDVEPSPAKDVTVVRGAGATFPNPLYGKWIGEYAVDHPNARIEYESIGSGEGTKLFLNQLVDFGASDAALTDEQMEGIDRGVQLVPATAGCVTIVYNVDGVPSGLKLPREVYTDIFLDKIRWWNDPKIQDANPDLELPRLPIAVVARQDGSGTTFAFTKHLATISDEWAKGPGAGKEIDWPGGAMLAAGNAGVATRVSRVPGGIGYVEFGLADRIGLTIASLENKAGNFVTPSGATGMETLKNAPLPENLRAFFPDPEGETSYPIATYTWLLLYKDYSESPEVGKELKAFVNWCLTDGQRFSEDLGYIRLAPEIAEKAVTALESIKL